MTRSIAERDEVHLNQMNLGPVLDRPVQPIFLIKSVSGGALPWSFDLSMNTSRIKAGLGSTPFPRTVLKGLKTSSLAGRLRTPSLY